ncbi:MAG: ATP-binding protein, partial [Symploca sp. SIO3E6]|nr:ATP-binding protein [Caldora sp. SIO3E6]
MRQDSELLLDNLYNAFDPFEPLKAGDPNYVNCRDVRGDEDIVEDLGRRMRRARRMTCQLYTGHRGAGKSTELLRLKQYLEEQKFHVVYFAADEEDVDAEDTQYTDILLACTRHLLEDLKQSANPRPLLQWLQIRWQELRDLALTEVAFEGLSVESQISQFAKLTANLRAVPSLRQKIREKINPQTVTLIKALNEFIGEAKKQLPNGCQQLAVIADNLDRIVPITQKSGHTNHEEIFLDRSEQLKALDCHLIYTVPISLVYSRRAADLREIYSDPHILPMIMVQTEKGEAYQPGLNKIHEVISKRVRQFAPTLSLDKDIFDSPDTLEGLSLMSGGHVRNLLLLIQDAIGRTAELPISQTTVRRAITQARDTYRRTVESKQWSLLA